MNIEETAYLINKSEKTIKNLFDEKIFKGTIHLSLGQEIIDATIISMIKDPMIFGNHRSHGQFLALTNDVYFLFCEIGKGLTQHLYKKDCFLSNGIQGSMTSVANGYAKYFLDNKKNKRVLCFIGDGTLGEGIFYESLNIASLFRLPITFILYDNGFSMSKTLSGYIPKHMCYNLCKGFDIDFIDIDNGYDIENIKKLCSNHFLSNDPGFIYAPVFRSCGHSCNDTQAYRAKDEILQCNEDFFNPKNFFKREINFNKIDNLIEKIKNDYLSTIH